jgi:hypothetical protein
MRASGMLATVRALGLLLVGCLYCETAAARGAEDVMPAAAKRHANSDAEEAVENVDDSALRAGDEPDYYGDAYPSMDRTLDHLNARMLRRKTFGTLIGHRNREGVLSSPFYDLLGFDGGGLKIVLGLRYGILDDLDVGVLRQNGTLEAYDTWEFDARYRLLSQSAGQPFDFTLRVGVDWYNAPTANAAGGFLQVLISRVVANRALLGGGVLYASNSSGPTKSNNDAKVSTALLLQAEVRLLDNLALAAELTQNVAGFHERYPVISFGPKIVSNRHTFSFVISNTQYMTADSLITNTYRMAPKQWVLGFHITREIEL